MRGSLAAIIFCLITGAFKCQTSRLTVSPKRFAGFYNRIMSSTLIVPLNDKLNKEDSALMIAVKKYWTIGPYKFVSESEFIQIIKTKPKPANYIYLVEETYQRFKKSRMDWAHTKYYLSCEPDGVEAQDAPFIEFKLPVKTRAMQLTYPDYSFLYGLIVKQFNYDVQLMKEKEKYFGIEKRSLITASFKKELSAYANKNMLVSENDFENYMMHLPDASKKPAMHYGFKNYIAAKTGMDTARIKMVSEDSIFQAVLNNNEGSLVYTGFTVYNAADGKMLRRIDVSSKKRKEHAAITTGITGVCILAALLVFF